MLTNNQQAFLMKIAGWLSEAGDKLTVVFTSAGVGFSINLKNGYDGLLVDEADISRLHKEQFGAHRQGKLDSINICFKKGPSSKYAGEQQGNLQMSVCYSNSVRMCFLRKVQLP